MNGTKPPGPAGTPCPTCGYPREVRLCTSVLCMFQATPSFPCSGCSAINGFCHEPGCRVVLGQMAQKAALSQRAPAAPVEAPFVASRAELGEDIARIESGRGGAGPIVVTLPGGGDVAFPTQAEADAFIASRGELGAPPPDAPIVALPVGTHPDAVLARLDLEIEWFERLIDEEAPRGCNVDSYRLLLLKLRQVRGDEPSMPPSRKAMDKFFTDAAKEPNHRPTRAEMEALLREIQWSGDSFAGTATVCPRCHWSPERGHRGDCAVGVLLARIDAAGKR